jgi:hypothetical protein
MLSLLKRWNNEIQISETVISDFIKICGSKGHAEKSMVITYKIGFNMNHKGKGKIVPVLN